MTFLECDFSYDEQNKFGILEFSLFKVPTVTAEANVRFKSFSFIPDTGGQAVAAAAQVFGALDAVLSPVAGILRQANVPGLGQYRKFCFKHDNCEPLQGLLETYAAQCGVTYSARIAAMLSLATALKASSFAQVSCDALNAQPTPQRRLQCVR